MRHFALYYPTAATASRVTQALHVVSNRAPQHLQGAIVWIFTGDPAEAALYGALLVTSVEEADEDAGYLFALSGSVGGRFAPWIRLGRARWFPEMVESLGRFRPELQELFERPYIEGLSKRALDWFEQENPSGLGDEMQDLRRALHAELGGLYVPQKRAEPKRNEEAESREAKESAPKTSKPSKSEEAAQRRAARSIKEIDPEPEPAPRFVPLPPAEPEPNRWCWLYRGSAAQATDISLEGWPADSLTEAGDLLLLYHAGQRAFIGLARATENARASGRQFSCEAELLLSLSPPLPADSLAALAAWSPLQAGLGARFARLPGELWESLVSAEAARPEGGSLRRVLRQLRFDDAFAHEIAKDAAERHPRHLETAKRAQGATCAACGFDFGKTYGAHGADFIELHARHAMKERGRVVLGAQDFVPLCANCHRMIHAGPRPLSVEELREIIRAARAPVESASASD
jgi:hypothetical protein